MSPKPNKKGQYRVYNISYNNSYYVGIATKEDNEEELNTLSIMNVRLFDGTIIKELLAGDIKFDC